MSPTELLSPAEQLLTAGAGHGRYRSEARRYTIEIITEQGREPGAAGAGPAYRTQG